MQSISNKGLLEELAPWLEEFGKLGKRGNRTLDLIKIYEKGDDHEFWKAYVANLMSDDERKAYDAHRSGTMKLQPFYEDAMYGMMAEFYKKVSGVYPKQYSASDSIDTIPAYQFAFDGTPETVYHLEDALEFDRKEGASVVTILTGEPTGEVSVVQFDKNGKELSRHKLETPYTTLPLSVPAVRLRIEGRTDIYEII